MSLGAPQNTKPAIHLALGRAKHLLQFPDYLLLMLIAKSAQLVGRPPATYGIINPFCCSLFGLIKIDQQQAKGEMWVKLKTNAGSVRGAEGLKGAKAMFNSSPSSNLHMKPLLL